jgi:aryl-alcohol dehydrogenase-like predicted oxidoreductase
LGTNSDYQESEITKTILDQLFVIAEELEVTPGQVVFAWVLSKGAFPIVGARTIEHIQDSLKALSFQLTPEHINQLNQLSAVPMGYPHDLLATVQNHTLPT